MRDYKFWIKRYHGGDFEFVTIQASDSVDAIGSLPKCVSWQLSTGRLDKPRSTCYNTRITNTLTKENK
jgi:hypothetical protein